MTEPIKPYNVDNPLHVKSRKKQAERDELKVKEAYRLVMSSAPGRLAILDVLNRTKFFQSAFAGSNRDTNFKCGQQEIGQALVKYLEEEFPKEYLQLETERLAAAIDAKIKDEANRTEGGQATEQQGEGE